MRFHVLFGRWSLTERTEHLEWRHISLLGLNEVQWGETCAAGLTLNLARSGHVRVRSPLLSAAVEYEFMQCHHAFSWTGPLEL